MEVGDWIVSVGDPAGVGLWRKPYVRGLRIGETQSLLVDREGQRDALDVVWGEPSGDFMRDRIIDDLVTLSFVGFCLWAFLSVPSTPGLILALFGLGYGLTNFHGPSLGIPGGAIGFVQSHMSFFYTVLLAHFLMVFPTPKRVFRWRPTVWLLYLPLFVCPILGVLEGFAYPSFRNEHALSVVFLDPSYMLLGLVALIHTWVVTPREGLRRSGFYWIPLGLAVAMGPFLVLGLIGMVVPGFSMPGSEFLPLLGAGIPAGMAMGVARGAAREQREE